MGAYLKLRCRKCDFFGFLSICDKARDNSNRPAMKCPWCQCCEGEGFSVVEAC